MISDQANNYYFVSEFSLAFADAQFKMTQES